jgi:hypothetical protein
MAKTSDTNNSDGFAGTATVLLQWRVHRDTSAKHRCRVRAVKALGDLQDEVAIGAIVRSISAVGFALVVGIDRAVGVNSLTVAMVLKSIRTVRAIRLEARACLRADTNAVALLNMLYILANLDGFANNLVTNDAGLKMSVECVGDEKWEDARYGVGPQPELSM